jgi:hypothetical protein
VDYKRVVTPASYATPPFHICIWLATFVWIATINSRPWAKPLTNHSVPYSWSGPVGYDETQEMRKKVPMVEQEEKKGIMVDMSDCSPAPPPAQDRSTWKRVTRSGWRKRPTTSVPCSWIYRPVNIWWLPLCLCDHVCPNLSQKVSVSK